ncbi:MAG: hypothetical protein KBG02_12010 [Haliscomenobacter sp.]|nr:cbb3-type cytochrome c oxidase subunit 3 [Haliscomenobacter sp.]MBP9077579.1 hypothetical protein [Haliscomenobacter sp.]MBP9873073.1 hypothetical protein [Haliscomenobacter sp.]
MFKYILENAGNINWMAIAALITFFTIFILSAAVVLRKDKAYIQKMSMMPLEDSISQPAETENRHEA